MAPSGVRLDWIGTAVMVFTLASLAARGADAPVLPAAPAKSPVLHLVDGGFLPGELRDARGPALLRWQAPAFTDPFDFAVNQVASISFPARALPPVPSGDYQFELDGGDVLFGMLVRLTADEAELDLGEGRRLRIDRKQLLRIFRWRDNAATLYLGPDGLSGWEQSKIGSKWREEGGQLVADEPGTFVRRDFSLPAKACIEFEVSWKNKADFLLAVGVNNDDKVDQHAFRFDVWENELVIQRETELEADVASLQEIKVGPGRVQFRAYLDQEQERIQVFASNGKQLADLKVASPKPRTWGGIRLANKRGDVRLERLQISRWNGEPPRAVQADKSRIHRADGSIVYGQVKEYDPATQQFVITGDTQETRIDVRQIESVCLSLPTETPPRSIRAVLHNHMRLSGELVKVADGNLWLACPGVRDPLPLPMTELNSLVVLRHEFPVLASGGRTGRLELEGTRLHGHLAPGHEQPTSSCLVWHPQGSATASPLRLGTAGRIVYREAAPPQPRRPPEPQRQAGLIERFFGAFTGNPPLGGPALPPSHRYLHLRTGDTIPCEVTRIDEHGVAFHTPLSDATLVAHDKVKAVELSDENRTIKVDKTKRERFLTLPRMQKENPPTHLIRSQNGDILRGRLTELDDQQLQVEVRLETKVIPRNRVSRIIWLHDDELVAPQPTGGAAGPPVATRVQALRSDGIRLTIFAEQLADVSLSGRSEVLGACRVDLNNVDQLLFGGAIEQAAAQLAYQQWKLQNAVAPKVAQDESGQTPDGRLPGIESALVGKPAPDFELALLGGKKFHLSAHQGQVVVLDFWATWCGPCLQAMPQVDRVVHEFKAADVRLVAVNLQESPSKITATLERLKLQTTVALDQDGVVADRYGATAIPMTVIIDRDGQVARLFIGGGPHFADQLRAALQALVPESTLQEPAP